MSYHIDRKEFDEWVEEKAWDRIWSAYEYAISGEETPPKAACYCSVIDGRQFLCGGCAAKLKEELEVLKDDNTDVRAVNRRLQDEHAETTARLEMTQRALESVVHDTSIDGDTLLERLRDEAMVERNVHWGKNGSDS